MFSPDSEKRHSLFPFFIRPGYSVFDFYCGIAVLITIDIPFKTQILECWWFNNKLPALNFVLSL